MRFAKSPPLAEPYFTKLGNDGDGKVTLEEFTEHGR